MTDTRPYRDPCRNASDTSARRARLRRLVLRALAARGCVFVGAVRLEHRRLAFELERLDGGLPTVRRVA